MSMVAAMIRGPVEDVVLQSAGAAQGVDEAQNRMCLVGLVRPQTVIPGGDGHAAEPHHQDETHPFEGIVAMGKPVPGHQRHGTEWCQGEEHHVGPVDWWFLHTNVFLLLQIWTGSAATKQVTGAGWVMS